MQLAAMAEVLIEWRTSQKRTERERAPASVREKKKRLMSIGNELDRNSLLALAPSAESVHERIITSAESDESLFDT